MENPVSDRHYGIDALRIVSMFMVIVVHVLSDGAVLSAANPLGANYFLAWLLMAVVLCAVNCYGLISGYVGIDSRYKLTNMAVLWLQGVCYNVMGTVIFFLINPAKVGRLRLLKAFLPVTQKVFWYLTAYTGLFCCIPLLNRAIVALSRRQAKALCIGIVLVFSVLPTTTLIDIFFLNEGMSALWLILLYIMGACIRRFDFFAHLRRRVLVATYGISVLAGVMLKVLMERGFIPLLPNFIRDNALLLYPSPTLLLCGIAVLLLFSKMNIQKRWLIKSIQILAPVSLGVYLIHMQTDIHEFIFGEGRFAFLARQNTAVMFLGILGIAVGIFLICGVVELVRIFVFRKLKIKERLLRIERKCIGDLWNKA